MKNIYSLITLVSLNIVSYAMNPGFPLQEIQEEQQRIVDNLKNIKERKHISLEEIRGTPRYIIDYCQNFINVLRDAPEIQQSKDEQEKDKPLNYIFKKLPQEHKIATVDLQEDQKGDIVIYQGKSLTLPRYSMNENPLPIQFYAALCYLQNQRTAPLARLLFGTYQEEQTQCPETAVLQTSLRNITNNPRIMKAYESTFNAIEQHAKECGCKKMILAGITRAETDEWYEERGYQNKTIYFAKNLE